MQLLFESGDYSKKCVCVCVCGSSVCLSQSFLPSTPGTDFMARLHEQLQYFVNKKMATDPSWQKVEVILSGQNVRHS